MRRLLRIPFPVRVIVASVLLAGLAVSAPAAQAAPTPAPPTVIDGPSPNIVGLSGIDVARDGTGGLVYLKDVGGVAHVFVSQLVGSFQPPQRIDTGLSGPSSQPVIAAGNGGLLLIAFINGGELYVVNTASTTSGYTSPMPLAAGAGNPAIAITNLSKAYLAFTTTGAGGHDVRCAYYYQGVWGVEPGVLDANPGDDAGAGTGRPAVAASGDGVGVVAWGEAGHIYTRRVWGIPPSGTGPSIAAEQADVPSLGGWNESSSSDPVLSTGGDSSYVAVAFQETFSSGSQQQSRVLMQQLQGSDFNGLIQPDGLSTPGPDGSDQPAIESGEYGQGWVTSEHQSSHELFGMQMNNNESPGAVMQIDSLPNYDAPYAFPAPAGYHSALIAWQETPAFASPEIRARFYDGTSLLGEQVLSSPSMGSTEAADGLFAAGDIAADVAVAWVQGNSGSQSIVTAQLYQAPGSFKALSKLTYARTTEPVLSWKPAKDSWGPVQYQVTVNGTRLAPTTATSIRVPFPLGQGRHGWWVKATNPAGLTSSSPTATVFVDTIKPKVHVKLSGVRKVGDTIRVRVTAKDNVGVPKRDASGVKTIRIKWGDGKSSRIKKTGTHVYRRARRYKITVTVTDKAGNSTKVVLHLRIS